MYVPLLFSKLRLVAIRTAAFYMHKNDKREINRKGIFWSKSMEEGNRFWYLKPAVMGKTAAVMERLSEKWKSVWEADEVKECKNFHYDQSDLMCHQEQPVKQLP